jgi:predicted  nucleic acid-binding Zn-ribbon protein
MTKAPPDERLVKDLRAAADRLIAGTPLRSPGKLTISDLAAEAGIKRWVLTHKHPELMQRYQAEFQTLGQKPVPLQAALDTITQLENDLARVRADKRRLQDLVDTYAAVINDLTDELTLARQQRDSAIAELDQHRDKVTVLADHRPPCPRSDAFTCS